MVLKCNINKVSWGRWLVDGSCARGVRACVAFEHAKQQLVTICSVTICFCLHFIYRLQASHRPCRTLQRQQLNDDTWFLFIFLFDMDCGLAGAHEFRIRFYFWFVPCAHRSQHSQLSAHPFINRTPDSKRFEFRFQLKWKFYSTLQTDTGASDAILICTTDLVTFYSLHECKQQTCDMFL